MAIGVARNGVDGDITIPAVALAMGKAGTVVQAHITRWTADIQHEVFDTTPFTAATPNNFREKTGGLVHIVGSCEGFMDSNLLPTLDAAANSHMVDPDGRANAGFVLRSSKGVLTDAKYEFDAIISNLNLSVEKRGMATFSLNFESSGGVGGSATDLVTQTDATDA